MIALFDERYVVVTSTVVVVVTSSIKRKMPYQEFNKIKPPEFDGVRDPILAMKWMSYVEGFFYTCACPKNLKFRYTKNLLRLGEKDW